LIPAAIKTLKKEKFSLFLSPVPRTLSIRYFGDKSRAAAAVDVDDTHAHSADPAAFHTNILYGSLVALQLWQEKKVDEWKNLPHARQDSGIDLTFYIWMVALDATTDAVPLNTLKRLSLGRTLSCFGDEFQYRRTGRQPPVIHHHHQQSG
jgi:hypothetical protein